jgi:hypothetical protein
MKTNVTINDVKKIDLPQIIDVRGNLSFVEEYKHIPFKIKTAYWINDVPGGEGLEGYSVKESSEFIVAISGNFDVVLNDGYEEGKSSLNRSYFGLYVPAMIWRRIENFSTNSLVFILSSTSYVEDDRIRNFENFLALKKHGRKG